MRFARTYADALLAKNWQKKHTNHTFLHSTFFDALEAFIYKARRAYFFSREKIPLKFRLIACYL